MHYPKAPWRKMLAANLWLAAACLAAGWIGQLLAAHPGEPPPLSLAAGFGIAALYSGGWRMLPGLIVATILPALLPAFPGAPASATPALLLAGAALLQAVAGAALLRRWVDPAIASGRAVLRFLLLTPLICGIRATLSVGVLAADGALPSGAGALWFHWWIGDAIGILLGAPLCWAAVGRPRALWRPRRLLVALPLVVAVAAFIAIYQQALVWERDEQLQTFRMKAQEVGQMMQSALSEHERFIAGVARAIDDPGVTRVRSGPANALTPANFTDIARSYLHQRPELLAMAWLPRVTDAQRPGLEAWASAYYGRNFELLDIVGTATRRAARRPDYYPILLIEPASSELLLGRDFMSELERGRALTVTLQSGRPAASAPVRLRQTGTLGINLLQRVAGPQPDGPPAGVLNLALRADTYLGRAVAQSGFAYFLVAFADTTERAAPVRVIDTIGPAAGVQQYRKELAFGGRRYELRLAPSAAYLRTRPGWQSWSVLTGGLLLTALMGALMLVISGERTQIQAQVDDATSRLREREARLQAILDNAGDAIITVDQRGMVLSANAAAGALFVYAPHELPGLRIEHLLDLPLGDGADALPRLARGGGGRRELGVCAAEAALSSDCRL